MSLKAASHKQADDPLGRGLGLHLELLRVCLLSVQALQLNESRVMVRTWGYLGGKYPGESDPGGGCCQDEDYQS